MELGAFSLAPFAGADVARDLGRADDAPVGVLDRRDRQRNARRCVPSLCRRTVSNSTGSPARMLASTMSSSARRSGGTISVIDCPIASDGGVAEHPLGSAVPRQ